MSHSDLWGSGWWCGMATTDGSTSRLRQRWKIEPLSLQGFLWIKLPTRRRIGDDHQNLILQSLLDMTRIALSCYIWLPGIPPWYLKITAIELVIGTFIYIGDFFHRYNTPILLLHDDKSPMLWQQRHDRDLAMERASSWKPKSSWGEGKTSVRKVLEPGNLNTKIDEEY